MKSQGVLISAYIATAIIVLVVTVLFLRLYAYTSSYRVEEYGVNIFDIIRSRPKWTAESLAKEIILETNANYVKINIVVYDLLTEEDVDQDYYEIKTVGVDIEELILMKYNYTVTSDAYIYAYYIEVGFR
ncbi:MAG: hypothetical protein J7L82_01600 [Staphylothermus sp.]|nr:hypothetical protein [Staphylothermus sp.]